MAGNRHPPCQGTGTEHQPSKRLGEEGFFSGAFVVFRHISVIFSLICLEGKRFFVYLQAIKGVATNCPPEYINVNKLKMLRNALKLNLLCNALRKGVMLLIGKIDVWENRLQKN